MPRAVRADVNTNSIENIKELKQLFLDGNLPVSFYKPAVKGVDK
jgi:hypothetical protein